MSDREGHGHKAIVYKSHFPPLRHFSCTETPTDTLANKPRLQTRPKSLFFMPPRVKNKKKQFVPCLDRLQIFQCIFLPNEEQEFGLEARSFLCDYRTVPGSGSRMRLVCKKTSKHTFQWFMNTFWRGRNASYCMTRGYLNFRSYVTSRFCCRKLILSRFIHINACI